MNFDEAQSDDPSADMSGVMENIKKILANPQQANAIGQQALAAAGPEQKQEISQMANNIASQQPATQDVVPAEAQAMPNGTQMQDAGPAPRNRRDELRDYLTKKKETGEEYKTRSDELAKDTDTAKWKDAAMYLVNGMGAATSDLLGYKEAAQQQRGRLGQDEYSPQMTKRSEELRQWLKDKQAQDSGEYIQGIKGIGEEEKNAIEAKKETDLDKYRMDSLNRGPKEVDPGGFKTAAQELAKRRQALAEAESARKAGMIKGQGAKDAEKRKVALDTNTIPFMEGKFIPAGEPIPKEIFSKVVDKVATQAEAEEALGRLKTQAEYVVAHPIDPDARAEFNSMQNTAMALLSNATGQGAMSDNERKSASSTVGDVSNMKFWLDQARGLVSGDKEEHSRAVRSIEKAQGMFRGLAMARAKSANMKFVGSEGPAASASKVNIEYTDPAGKIHGFTLTKQAADDMLQKHKGHVRVVQ